MADTRNDIINGLFESMGAMKRGLSGQLHTLNDGLAIPRSQLELLFTIKHAQPVSFKQLAALLYLTPGAVSQLADGLEKHQLIEREIDDHDRRIQCLKLTKKGQKVLQELEKKRRTILERVMQDLDTEELNTWLRIHQKLIEQFHTEAA
jgi:DNA-binding MarR family transcriptional regulator